MKTFYDENYLNYGMQQYVEVEFTKAPHWALSGITGSGKTYALKLLLARIAKDISDSMLTICDYKGDQDFDFLKEEERFYRFDRCQEGLNRFYESFLETQQTGTKTGMHFFVFDEWASFLINLDKKEAEDARKKLSALLMLGRSFGYHVILSQQRLDAEYFGKTRDNFSVVLVLGNPSKEVQEMFFHDFKEQISHDRRQGTGYMLINGAAFRKIVVPGITSMERINRSIEAGITRTVKNV